MASKVVTFETSQPLSGWLKDDAPEKVPYKVVTGETSHSLMSSLKLAHAGLQPLESLSAQKT